MRASCNIPPILGGFTRIIPRTCGGLLPFEGLAMPYVMHIFSNLGENQACDLDLHFAERAACLYMLTIIQRH